MSFEFGHNSKLKLQGVEEITRKLCDYALMVSTVDFSVIDGLRTQKQQQEMFKLGKSELDGIISVSDHQLGLAIDVVPYIKDVDGNPINPFDVDNEHLKIAYLEMYRAFMRAAFKLGVAIEFGFAYNIGDGFDWPHISIKGKMPNSHEYKKELTE